MHYFSQKKVRMIGIPVNDGETMWVSHLKESASFPNVKKRH